MKLNNIYMAMLTIILTFVALLLLDFMGEENPVQKVAKDINNLDNYIVVLIVEV